MFSHCLISNQFYIYSNHLDYEIHEHASLGSSLVRFFKVWGWLSIWKFLHRCTCVCTLYTFNQVNPIIIFYSRYLLYFYALDYDTGRGMKFRLTLSNEYSNTYSPGQVLDLWHCRWQLPSSRSCNGDIFEDNRKFVLIHRKHY